MSTREVIVASIARAHGLRGEVGLILRTDVPEERIVPGAAFTVATAGGRRTLTVATVRSQQDRWYVRFDEVTDRDDAESLRGVELPMLVDEAIEAEEDPDAWYPDQLTGLAVRHVDGRELGTVVDVQHYPAQDLLVVRTPQRTRVQLPLVEQLVPEVDLEAGVVIADPPGGLFEELPAEAAADGDDAAADADRG